MFTGIIEATGTVSAITRHGGDMRLRIDTNALPLSDVALGDSVAASGVCLTVVELGDDWYSADVSVETLTLTTMGELTKGSRVNLEKALALGARLGGHLVSGHVDGVGEVVDRWADARSQRFRLRAPKQLACYIATKGSICVDGISLTINKVDGAEFELNIIPATLEETTMGSYQPGQRVNLEVDILARYMERLLLGARAAEPGLELGGISRDFLIDQGYGDDQD